MKKAINSGLLWAFLLPCWSIFAQSAISKDSICLSLFTEYIYEDTIHNLDSLPALKYQTIKAIIQIRGEGNLERTRAFEISLGSAEGGSDLLFFEFLFDNNMDLPNYLSYYRDGNIIFLTLGRDLIKPKRYCTLRVKDINGQYTLPIFN